MYFIADFTNFFISTIFFMMIVRNRIWSIILFTIHFVLANTLTMKIESFGELVWHYHLISYIFFVLVIYRKDWLHESLLVPVYDLIFNTFRLRVDDSRVKFIFRLWFFTIAITSDMGFLLSRKVALVSHDFYVSWSVNVLFFTAIGLAAALVSLRTPRDEAFDERLSNLFAANLGGDSGLREGARKHTTAKIKTVGFVNAAVERRITVEEYSPVMGAYRALVTVKTNVVNLFGDVDAKDIMHFSVMPDKFVADTKPPAVLGQIVSLSIKGNEQITSPMPIVDGAPTKFPQEFTVGKDGEDFIFKYWSWFAQDQFAYFTPARYCRRVSVTIVNRILDGDQVSIPIKFLTGEARVKASLEGDEKEDGNEDDKNYEQFVLKYGEQTTVADVWDIGPDQRQELFKFLQPPAKNQALDSPEKSPKVTDDGNGTV